MANSTPVIPLVLAFAAVAAFLAIQQTTINSLREDVKTLSADDENRSERAENVQQRKRKVDADRAMRAICVLGEFAQMERAAGPEQTQTIQSAEFELLYFTQQYLTNSFAGRPIADFILASPEEWHILGEYYSAMEAISVSLEATKASTAPHISPDGNVRHLLERISRWIAKRSLANADE